MDCQEPNILGIDELRATRAADDLIGHLVSLRYGRLSILDFVPLYRISLVSPFSSGIAAAEESVLSFERDLRPVFPLLLASVFFFLIAYRIENTYWTPSGSKPFLLVAWVLLGVATVLGIGTIYFLSKLRKWLLKEGVLDELLTRMSFRDDSLQDIHNWTIEPFRSVFLHTRVSSISRLIELAASNVDWFAGAPRPIIRLNWITELFMLPFAVLCGLAAYLMGSSIPLHEQPFTVMLITVTFFGVFVSLVAARRREVMMEAFIRKLRSAFEL